MISKLARLTINTLAIRLYGTVTLCYIPLHLCTSAPLPYLSWSIIPFCVNGITDTTKIGRDMLSGRMTSSVRLIALIAEESKIPHKLQFSLHGLEEEELEEKK